MVFEGHFQLEGFYDSVQLNVKEKLLYLQNLISLVNAIPVIGDFSPGILVMLQTSWQKPCSFSRLGI